jgi:hypothetical protein
MKVRSWSMTSWDFVMVVCLTFGLIVMTILIMLFWISSSIMTFLVMCVGTNNMRAWRQAQLVHNIETSVRHGGPILISYSKSQLYCYL